MKKPNCEATVVKELTAWKETIDAVLRDADSFSFQSLHERLRDLRDRITLMEAAVENLGELDQKWSKISK